MKKLINKLKIPLLAGAFVLFSASDLPKNKAEDIKVLPSSGTVYHLSREEAEKGIRGLAKTAYEEDAWIYHDGVLTDVGYDIKKDSVAIDWGLILLKDFNPNKNLYRYHPHLFNVWGDKVIPPSGSDFFCDRTCKGLTKLINLKENQVISKVFDFSGEWAYTSNLTLEDTDPMRRSNRLLLISYNHMEAFPGKERTEEDIEFFIKRMEEDGFEVKYKKLE